MVCHVSRRQWAALGGTGSAAGGRDETVASLGVHTFFYNLWQGELAGGTSAGAANGNPQTQAEVGLFGLPPFARPARPTWSEASDRLIYIAHNLRQISTGSDPNFGDVTAVFKTAHASPMADD